MEIPKLIILLCTCYAFASEEPSHVIPVEHYETELQDLGEHVEYPETPVKVIKITKTVAVKIPVPYPVKVVEKVPYPVHVAKPYPVPVPQIVHIPQPAHPQVKAQPQQVHHPLDVPHVGFQPAHQENSEEQYQVQETPSNGAYTPSQENQSYNGNSDHNHNFGLDGYPSYESPGSHYSYSGDNHDNGPYESKRREQVVNYQKMHNPIKSGRGF